MAWETPDEIGEVNCLLPDSENALPVCCGRKVTTKTKTSKTPKAQLARSWRVSLEMPPILNYPNLDQAKPESLLHPFAINKTIQ